MSWIEQTLADLARRRRGLQAGAPGENAPQPTGPVGFHPGPRGMVDRSQALGLGEQDRTLALVQGYQKYLKRSGRRRDPLMDTKRITDMPGGGARYEERTPAKLLGDPANPFRVNQTDNARRGLTFQQMKLADGRRVNVYYGANGQRTVVPLPKRRKR